MHYEKVCLRNNRKPVDFDTRYDDKAKGNAIRVYSDTVLHHVTGQNGTPVLPRL
ncbi:hypothetical protein [Rhizobium sp. AN73]|uniref:hypothetical protein n=1 Tax=Rhizobium sp. AN73 TaxID=3035124 RepID=UPI0027415534|nr:hypothetical protein [Rhizobium sp. AN73]